MSHFHFLRPWYLLLLMPLLIFSIQLWKQSQQNGAWEKICDAHLLPHLLQRKEGAPRHWALLYLLLATFFLCISLAGPCWNRVPIPVFKSLDPKVLVLDLSATMLSKDLSPDRLTRAKFKLQDLLQQKTNGQWGMVVFTEQPFVVSPLTDDAKTILSLLPELTPNIMPVDGYNLPSALNEAATLIDQAGYTHGQILVLTAATPDIKAENVVAGLAKKGIKTSIMPITNESQPNALYQTFARKGEGQLVLFTDARALQNWVAQGSSKQWMHKAKGAIPLWRDEGRWFLIPVLCCLIPFFRRGWFARVYA